jgi:hypothetical protein
MLLQLSPQLDIGQFKRGRKFNATSLESLSLSGAISLGSGVEVFHQDS